MTEQIFEKPVLNSPFTYPARHWELDADSQPTSRIIENRRAADFITPIPKPKKRKKSASGGQPMGFTFGEGFTEESGIQYNPTEFIQGIRQQVDQWRQIPNPENWRVTPDTARIAVKVINYLGDEVMKVFSVD